MHKYFGFLLAVVHRWGAN